MWHVASLPAGWAVLESFEASSSGRIPHPYRGDNRGKLKGLLAAQSVDSSLPSDPVGFCSRSSRQGQGRNARTSDTLIDAPATTNLHVTPETRLLSVRWRRKARRRFKAGGSTITFLSFKHPFVAREGTNIYTFYRL